ncbi:hypothetical protein LOTGIDRAFT_170344 [Lottia gigantea]|uniref:G-protein coupled receptors family 1 profile domain-containing protein n=1 Tax=Lottia gigantea TaxID=225164 RepID=V3ZIC9_LOTGI|nr:hypothetical protein LOTGIDRAFT_170344 [Lottia gigantea]ESO82070.1 hypothetical protein LOTGIDRAFT_170344 [Lottia gigantea]
MAGRNETSAFESDGTNTTVLTGSPWSFSFSTTMAVILSISSVLTVVGNLMVITVVIRYPVMRTRTNLFLTNLAVADLMVGLLLVPCSITTLVAGKWVLGNTVCSINGFLTCFCLVTSIHTLMYISVHKCYSLPRAQSDSFKLSQILLMIAATWIWAGFLSTITVTGLNHVYYKKYTSQCGPSYPHDLKTYIHHTFVQVTGIIIPLVTMVICYFRMFRTIWYHSQSLKIHTTLDNNLIVAQQKKIFKTLIMVLACFILCWIPYQLYASYTTIVKDKEHFSPYINPVAYLFGYINSAFNPIIYALRSKSFRHGYKEIWCQTTGYIMNEGLNVAGRPRGLSNAMLVPVMFVA